MFVYILIKVVTLPRRFWKNDIKIEVRSVKSEARFITTIDKFSMASKHTIAAFVMLLISNVVLNKSSSNVP
jgi:hypothetical protein